MVGTSSKKIAAIAALSTLIPNGALPQQTGGTVVTGTTTTTGVVQPGTTTYAPATATTAATTTTPTTVGPVATQKLPNAGGLQIDFNVTSNLSVDDNFELNNNSTGTSTIWDNTLGFDLSNITPTQDFRLTATGVLRFAEIPGRSVSGFEDPNLRLTYALNGYNSRLSFDGRYRKADREFLDPFQVEQEEQALGQLIGGGGTVTWNTYGANFVTGINNPLGFQLGVKHDERTYDATAQAVNPLLFDQTTDTANATVTMKVSPLMQLRASAGIKEYDAQDAPNTQRQTLDYAVGALMDINPVLKLDAQVGYTDVTTDTNTGRTTQSGATSSVQLTQTLPNGTVYGSFISTVNQNGTQSTLSFGRDLTLLTGNFIGQIGVTHTPAGNDRLSGTLAYTRTLNSSAITVTAGQAVSTNGANQDVLNTRLSVAYNYVINPTSSLNLSLNWGRSESADNIAGFNDTDRTTFRAAYSHVLTQDWNLSSGLQMRHRSDNSGNAQSNSVFVTLDRSFSYRP